MGGDESKTKNSELKDLLDNDVNINFKAILSDHVISSQELENLVIQEIIAKKKDKVISLIKEMVGTIMRISGFDDSTKFKDEDLISLINSFFLFSHLSEFCITNWDYWEIPNGYDSFPSCFFISSFSLLRKTQIMNSIKYKELGFNVKCMLLKTVLKLLLVGYLPKFQNCPNINYSYLDEVDPLPIFNVVLNYPKRDEFYRVCLIVASNGIPFCQSWKSSYAGLDPLKLKHVFNYLLKFPNEQQMLLLNSQSPGIFYELTSLFYQTLLYHNRFLEMLSQEGGVFIVSLLFVFQTLGESNALSYFHSLSLSIFVLLTSDENISKSLNDLFTENFPCKKPIHRGNYGDLLIEIITNFVKNNLKKIEPFLSAICCLFYNISSHMKTFSFFACNRLFNFFKLLIQRTDEQSKLLIQMMIDSFTNIIAYQFNNNTNVLIFILREIYTFRTLSKNGYNTKYIILFKNNFISSTKSLQSKRLSVSEVEIILKSMNSNDFITNYCSFGSRTNIFTNEMADLWMDWIKTILMRNCLTK